MMEDDNEKSMTESSPEKPVLQKPEKEKPKPEESNPGKPGDRRYFPRIKVRSYGKMANSEGRQWPVHVLDLSFNGALAALLREHTLAVGEAVSLAIEVDDQDERPVIMRGRVSHCREHLVGIECRTSGIDNQTRLREFLKRCQRREAGFPEVDEFSP